MNKRDLFYSIADERLISHLVIDHVTPAVLEGRPIGPVEIEVTPDRVAIYVEATGDDLKLWSEKAPPGFASILLFAVAEGFLYDPEIVPFTRTLLHLDQTFTYLAPMRVGSVIKVSGEVTRVRQRGSSYFVVFTAEALDGERVVMESSSTFVLSDQEAPEAENELEEPSVRERGENEGSMRSASRHDLVRYSSATRDFNPLHWDHGSALSAGLPGVVVHGLLMYAWIAQEVASDGGEVAEAKIRFRNALLPGQQAAISLDRVDSVVSFVLSVGDERLVTGTATVEQPTE